MSLRICKISGRLNVRCNFSLCTFHFSFIIRYHSEEPQRHVTVVYQAVVLVPRAVVALAGIYPLHGVVIQRFALPSRT